MVLDDISKKLDDILKMLLAANPEIETVAIVSAEGLPIASALPQGVDETKIAAMAAALFSLAERSVIEMEKGEFDQLYVKGSDGYLLVLQAGPNAVLTVSTTKNVRLDSLFSGRRGEDGDFPFPYITKPPSPPGDLGLAGRPQAKEPITKQVLKDEPYCKHCGAELPKGQTICHVCGKKVG